MPSYNQLVQFFKNAGAPGANGAAPFSPEWNDAYNNYFGNLASQQGVGTFESLNLESLTPGSTSSVPGATVTSPPPQMLEAPMPSNVGNYNQTQNAVQAGQFGTVGSTTQDSRQTTQQSTQGTQSTRPDDIYGFGQLLRDQAGAAQGTDAARTAWLTDVMNNGGTGFQQQLDAGIRQSLSGPGMMGVGDEGRGRTAGAAAADIGRNNLNQRLGASQQLAGGTATGLTALANAAQPYGVGQTTTTAGTTTGLSELMARATEAQAGTTSAQSSQAGAGQIPESQPVKTGGCVLCTAAIELKLSNHHRVLRRVIRHKLITDNKRFANAAKGYFAVFTPLAAYLLSHRRLATILWPLAKFVVYEELRVSGRRLPFRLMPWLTHWVGHTFCAAVGATLPVKGYVDNQRILNIASRERILYPVEG